MKKKGGLFFSLIFLFASLGCVSAIENCTKYVSTIGVGTSCTEVNPCSLATASGTGVGSAQPGDVVCLKEGTYYETLASARSGTVNAKITYKAYPGEECKTNADGTKYGCQVKIDGENTRNSVVISKDYIRIEGLDISKGYNSGVTIGGYTGSEVVNNYIHDNTYLYPDINQESGWGHAADQGGIDLRNSDDTLIENNEVYHNLQNGIIILGDSILNLRIINNNIHDNIIDGIKGGDGDNWIIEDNKIHDHTNPAPYNFGPWHADSLQLQEGINGLKILNNEFYDATQHIYLVSDTGNTHNFYNVEIAGNLIYKKDFTFDAKGIFVIMQAPYCGITNNLNVHSNTVSGMYQAILIGPNCGQITGNVNLRDNIVTDNFVGLGLSPMGAVITSDYNLYHNSVISWNGWYDTLSQFKQANPAQEVHSISADPFFENEANNDYHLKLGSPAIDAGDLIGISLPSPFLDIDGTLRPQGEGYDIGAYEYISEMPPAQCVLTRAYWQVV